MLNQNSRVCFLIKEWPENWWKGSRSRVINDEWKRCKKFWLKSFPKEEVKEVTADTSQCRRQNIRNYTFPVNNLNFLDWVPEVWHNKKSCFWSFKALKCAAHVQITSPNLNIHWAWLAYISFSLLSLEIVVEQAWFWFSGDITRHCYFM